MNAPVLWTAADAARATGGDATASWSATGVSIDTRTLQEGDLFVALKAARDGHEFVAQALAKGAAAALVSHVPDGVPPDAPLLIVPDVLAALEDLARAARDRTRAKVIGVTGSVGKTSTKEMLRMVLSGQGRTHAAEASYNNHWGVPLTLARMPADTEFAVIEIGMNAPGEIAPLSRLARPHVVMVTTVAAAHLEAFENLDGIAHEKASIADGLEPAGFAVLNGDIDTTHILQDRARAMGAKVLTFGEAARNHHRATVIRLIDTTTVVRGRAWRRPMLFKVQAAGRHFAVNGMGVLAVVSALGLDLGIAASDLGRWAPPAGRGARERIHMDTVNEDLVFELIDDAFNANPSSMAAALEVLAAARTDDGIGRVSKGRRIAILGDMLELGQDEIAMHVAIADLPWIASLDRVHCVGQRMRHLHEALPANMRGEWHADAGAMAARVRRLLDAGDVVLVKGSKGSKVSAVVDALRKLGHAARSSEKGAE
ncbi:UDP-N-acetylmuramoyl-tripeptide--D-alanyl-D-alanine ligase [Lutimaribacter sp. EGI FJ00015]|uniref:UDP-N-acetylmuramoyl-tripeptide--D-alanyl-D-alanine ligase n=1 Tax=Lutimaribacter degradans TaxID=2945989 RepID=A0ACC5ZSB7_9RHOB|nr:UDP-N-acetylmuramoyl-tripeptide--D-alanyl-D-alanine ligase [Lutimaribacter sp. EGI FJ00013]MCM2560676.1 UDP-N-acetylmuramoyl-tripeptide--D-alanyl-D-alanine ligase [Lutimaribacter sp. EGI FJ00013]MCO0612380.1 UDP-N-acetylmuramoyl-tripeptide--D-alanyl-D-alanine ligase [Lutimaribacter sp. EGI FJ00015]MCO0634500.1 UDP-N-acetylmuramoyl-tripeptide--D-alanyl-D-alanine ligase [Lutimaribacter sp. EGI FJ00014]